MPALIRSLAVSGSHKSDGTENASGRVYLYEPGTTTLVPGFTSDTLAEAWITTDGYIPLDESGRVAIWVNDPIDIVIADSTGTIINTHIGFNKTRAEQVEIEHEGFTGAVTDSSGAVSQGLGGKTFLHDVLTSAVSSLGPDFMYQQSPGATPRPYDEVIGSMGVSVKDFGARGDNIADDTVAVQAAVTEAKRLGAGLVLFPKGTYKTSAVPIALSTATGIEFRGVGQGASILSQSTPAVNAVVLTTCTDFTMRNMSVVGSVVMTDAVRPTFEYVTVSGGDYGINMGGTVSTDARINHCTLTGTTRALLFTNTIRAIMVGTQYNNLAGTAAVEYAGSTSLVDIFGGVFAASGTGVLFNAALTGVHFVIAGSPSLGTNTTLPIDMTGLAVLPDLRQWGNGVDASATSGASQTPVLYRGHELVFSSSVAAVTVNAPAILPGTAATDVGLYWDASFKNVAGTAWTLDAVFVLVGGVAPPSSIGHTIQMRFRWDRTTSKLRECFRADTVT